ncbi:Protein DETOXIFICATION 16 [Turnera subulata]|uniref:Protein DETOXIFICATION n=1 Tax=Turnera subulata TaxID=218843 RepID=A0A9Q0JEV1_9ROSI|nr:Protein DETOXIFICATION 16 [Turnera subulata]
MSYPTQPYNNVFLSLCLSTHQNMERDEQTSPLISRLRDRNEDPELDEQSRRNRDHGAGVIISRKEILEEVEKQLWLSGPLILANLLQYSIQIISVMFVGHLGELSLSGASMGTSFAAVTGFSFLVGMASALDTFCGQSYGAKQYHMLGIHTQRAMFVLLLVSIPLAFIWANTETILVFCGQEKEIAQVAGTYAQFMIPSVFAYAILQCLSRFLQTQNIVLPMTICSGIATSLHILLCWLLIFKCGLGTRGAALANNFSYWINVLLFGLYIKFSPSCAKTWKGFSKEALYNIHAFLRLAIPSAVMVCLEMWSFEMMVLLSGLLPNPQLETSVLSISLNTGVTVWMIPYGLGGAASTRVSNELGAGRPKLAQLAVMVVVAIAIVEGILVGIILISVRNIWGYAYSNEKQVVKYVAAMLPIIAISNFLDGFQSVLSGIVRGCGWQTIGAYINLGSYYVVGFPSGVLLAFVLHIGGKGLWLGIICALTVQVVCLSTITIRTNWQQEAKKATERVYDSMHPADAVS